MLQDGGNGDGLFLFGGARVSICSIIWMSKISCVSRIYPVCALVIGLDQELERKQCRAYLEQMAMSSRSPHTTQPQQEENMGKLSNNKNHKGAQQIACRLDFMRQRSQNVTQKATN